MPVAVIDDDEDVRLSLATLIGSIGHEVMVFETAEDLIAYGNLERFGCFVSDLHMPGIDGLQLACRLRDVSTAPIILITGFANDDIQRRAEEAGIDRLLIKPFDPDALIEALETIFGPCS